MDKNINIELQNGDQIYRPRSRTEDIRNDSHSFIRLCSDFPAHAGSGGLHRCRPPARGLDSGTGFCRTRGLDRGGVSVQNIYVSQATLQITPAQISESIVKTTINQQLTERISEMQQEIMSRTSLSSIITDPAARSLQIRARQPAARRRDRDDAQPRHQDHHRLDCPASAGASAFSISFAYPDRTKAHDTVQTLITKFQEANLTSQRNQQNMVGNFVHDELSEAKAKLDQLNEALTKFRAENAGKLPEQLSMNMAQMTSLQQQARRRSTMH